MSEHHGDATEHDDDVTEQRDDSAQQAAGDAAIVGERLTGERDPRDPDGLLTVDQVAGGTHGATPEEGLSVPRDGRIEEPTATDD